MLAGLQEGGRFVLSIDCDGIDPAVFPAVAMPTPGGLTYEDCLDVPHALAARGTVAGLIVAEYVPERDDALRSSALVRRAADGGGGRIDQDLIIRRAWLQQCHADQARTRGRCDNGPCPPVEVHEVRRELSRAVPLVAKPLRLVSGSR